MSAGNKASSQQDIISNSCEVTLEYSEQQIDESPILTLTEELSAFEPELSAQSENINEIHPVYLQEEQEMSLSQVLAHYDPPAVTILEDSKQDLSQNIIINKPNHVTGEETVSVPLQSHHQEDAIAVDSDSAAKGDDNKSEGPFICIRRGCTNPAIVSIEWEDEYCSNECAVSHCKDSFTQWLASLK